MSTSADLFVYAALVYILWPSRAPRFFEVYILRSTSCLEPVTPLIRRIDSRCYSVAHSAAAVFRLDVGRESVPAGAKPTYRGALSNKGCVPS